MAGDPGSPGQPQAGAAADAADRAAIYQRPNTSKPAPENKVYPYLLGGLRIERANQGCYGASGEDKASSSLETTDGVPYAAAE